MQQLRILWVDDEIEQLKPFILFLTERGYNVKSVSNGSDAIECVLNEKFDLVLLDEMMPGLDGLTTLREIKKINFSLPVIMVTSLVSFQGELVFSVDGCLLAPLVNGDEDERGDKGAAACFVGFGACKVLL